MENASRLITEGKAVLGIELGSTRIRAVLIDRQGNILETGGHNWENHLVEGIWTYGEDEIWHGLQECYSDLASKVLQKYDVRIERLSAIGISGMMHG